MAYYDFTDDERLALNRIGTAHGCHSCGTKTPATLSGNWIADPQPPSAVNWGEKPQRLYPHCLDCKRAQGLHLREFILRNQRAPWKGVDVFGCIVFIADALSQESPKETDLIDGIYRRESCLAVGCVSYMDSVVQVSLGKPDPTEANVRSVYVGTIKTPSRWLAVRTADQDMIAGLPVASTIAQIEIWANHPVEPNRLIISAR